MQDHTPPTWFLKRLDREEPTDAVPVGEMSALAVAYARAMERHYASLPSPPAYRPGTCAPAEVPDLEEVIKTLEPFKTWRQIVALLVATRDGVLLEGRDLARFTVSSAGVGGCLGQAPTANEEYREAEQAMQRALQLPGGWIAYAASFLPDDPEETLLVLREYGEPYAHTAAYMLLKEWAEETIQRMPDGAGLLDLDEGLRADDRGDLECPGD